MPLEAIPSFISRLQMLYERTTGVKAASKSPKAPGSGPKGAIDKKKKDGKAKVAEKKEKKAPPPKPSLEDLDAELLSYQAARAADDEPAEAVPAAE